MPRNNNFPHLNTPINCRDQATERSWADSTESQVNLARIVLHAFVSEDDGSLFSIIFFYLAGNVASPSHSSPTTTEKVVLSYQRSDSCTDHH